MSDNNDPMWFTTEYEDGTDWPTLARQLVEDYTYGVTQPMDVEYYVVWFCFILGNAKALVSSTAANGKYYEVTFNREKNEVYIDTYAKTHNIKGELIKR